MNPIHKRPNHKKSQTILLALSPLVYSLWMALPCAGQTLGPSIDSATPTAQSIPNYEVEGSGALSESGVFTGETFHYSLTLSWEGNQSWLNIDPPEVPWPRELEQLDVRVKAGSKTGPSGPINEKSFLYDLKAAEMGTFRIPDVEIEILFQDSSTRTVEIPGEKVTVTDRPPPPSEKIAATLKKNKWILLGLAALVIAGLVVFFLSTRKETSAETPPADPWETVEGLLNRAEALQKAGQAREFFGALESTLLAGCTLCQGGEPRKLNEFSMIDQLENSVQQDFERLAGEIEERKYRPDQPRPEEMERIYKQGRRVLTSLKQIYQERGS